VPIVDLNRRFHQWNDEERPDPEMRRAFGLDDGGIGWEDLLTKRRAVILAEVGSGKSTEFAERARLMERCHAYVFHASVEDVGRDGLDGALSLDVRNKLAAWRQAADEAWFFIDSVDEAKLAGIKFERVVRKIAEGIHGGEERCHLFFSGRFTDWEPRRDIAALKSWLAVSSVISKPEPTPEEELVRIIRSERKPKEQAPPNEEPFVAIMAQLDRERVRLFADAAGVPQTDRFLEAIDSAGLWHFARRPLDLDWLVRYWQAEERLGTLQEMVERSIAERLKETNPDRSRADEISTATGLRAVERIGAAMVFGRRATIAIPDSETELVSEASLDLADVLPDWSGDDRVRLLTRAVFDPATFGRVRFHNDNDGTVRSFLAARWLLRLRQADLSIARLFRMVFADSYGLKVIRPSLNDTTAWLCLWDKDVANEVVRRAPELLLSAGDPAGLSTDIRIPALVALLNSLTTDDQEWPWFDNDQLRRFAQPDLGSAVLSLWPRYRTDKKAAQFLMRLIWLGELKECGPLIREVVFDAGADPTLRVFAGKALLSMADPSTRSGYAALIKANAATLPLRMVRDAVIELTPTLISTFEVLSILADVNIDDYRDSFDFERDSMDLAKKFESAADLDLFLAGLLGQLGSEIGDHPHRPPTKREEVFFPALAEVARRLLKVTPSNDAPDSAIEALLLISNRREHGSSVRNAANEALIELHRTTERRRRAFWRVATVSRAVSRHSIDQLWHIEFLGYTTGLKLEDVEWLLLDGLAKGGSDCRLAVSATLAIYHSHGQPQTLLARIAEKVNSDPIGREALQEWTAPRTPPQAELESEQEFREIQSRNKAELEQRDQSWIEFVRSIRSDTVRIARLKRPVPGDAHSDLLDLFSLLHGARSQSRYALDSTSPLERIAGPDVARAVGAGLMAHWRCCEPWVRSRRKLQERNSVRLLDLMGLTGVTLGATQDAAWAAKLSDEEARRATEYATLEINGFPKWLQDLAASHPAEVRTVLYREIKDELTREGVTFFETLQTVAYSDDGLAFLLAPALLTDLEAGLEIPRGALAFVLQIVISGLPESERGRFERLGIRRFDQQPAAIEGVQYLAAVFSLSPRAATSAFLAKVSTCDSEAETALVDRFLTTCFGHSISGTSFKTIAAPPADIIEELTLLSLRTERQVNARRRPSGIVYKVTDADYADRARNAIFSHFVKTPGAATYHTLRRLQNDSNSQLGPARLRALAEQRAAEDSETAPWPPEEAYAFEQSSELAPRTGRDLCSVLVGRIGDIQHELLHGDFSQRETVKGLASEKEVQKWLADRLRLRQGRSFSVEREPHVVDEKEPDVRVRAKATDASVSMEIKVAESWSLKELDDALEAQLCGRYLRSDRARHGVLLLVHQKGRSRGWEDEATGECLSFVEVVDRLRARALEICGEGYNSPQPEVAVLDVSAACLIERK
jgi:hypothetical protein